MGVTSSSFMSGSISGGIAVMNVPGTSVGASRRPEAARGFAAGAGAVFGIRTRTEALISLHPHADDDLRLGDQERERRQRADGCDDQGRGAGGRAAGGRAQGEVGAGPRVLERV